MRTCRENFSLFFCSYRLLTKNDCQQRNSNRSFRLAKRPILINSINPNGHKTITLYCITTKLHYIITILLKAGDPPFCSLSLLLQCCISITSVFSRNFPFDGKEVPFFCLLFFFPQLTIPLNKDLEFVWTKRME